MEIFFFFTHKTSRFFSAIVISGEFSRCCRIWKLSGRLGITRRRRRFRGKYGGKTPRLCEKSQVQKASYLRHCSAACTAQYTDYRRSGTYYYTNIQQHVITAPRRIARELRRRKLIVIAARTARGRGAHSERPAGRFTISGVYPAHRSEFPCESSRDALQYVRAVPVRRDCIVITRRIRVRGTRRLLLRGRFNVERTTQTDWYNTHNITLSTGIRVRTFRG